LEEQAGYRMKEETVSRDQERSCGISLMTDGRRDDGSVKSGEISWNLTTLWTEGFYFRTTVGEMLHHGEVSDLPLKAEGCGEERSIRRARSSLGEVFENLCDAPAE